MGLVTIGNKKLKEAEGKKAWKKLVGKESLRYS